jgi:SAM-dependent methyltransferase
MADQGSEGLLSPWLSRIRFKAAIPYILGRVLDYGCGTGGLAYYVKSDCYLGVEIDEDSLQKAKGNHPFHTFESNLSMIEAQFDTVISLAVIEHADDPIFFLINLKQHLASTDGARIVITTPHPSVDWVHDAGAAVGIFSRHANEEHQDLLNKEKLIHAGRQAGLELVLYKRFLLGANQLVVFKRNSE